MMKTKVVFSLSNLLFMQRKKDEATQEVIVNETE